MATPHKMLTMAFLCSLLSVHSAMADVTAFEKHLEIQMREPSTPPSPLPLWSLHQSSDSIAPGPEQRLRGSQEGARKLLVTPRRAYGLVAPPLTSQPTRANVNASFRWESHVAVPEWVDWRETAAKTSVHDQGACGSCWAVASADAVTMAARIAGEGEGEILEGSAQEICDCGSATGGCQGGWPETALAYVYATGGISSRQAYPYKAANNTCQAGDIHPQQGLALAGWEAVPARSVLAMKKAVAMGPVITFINAENLHAYRGGFFSGPCGGAVNHVVLIVGYATCPTNGLYWIVKNSWGPQWGDDGYIYIKASEGLGTCGITSLQGLFPVALSLSSPCRGSVSPCGAGTCRVEEGAARCTCPPGFTENRQTNPPKCVRADPCAQNPNPCGAGVCENSLDGNYFCACPEGLVVGSKGDGSPTCVGGRKEGVQTHTLIPGDTCQKVASRWDVSFAEFRSMNSWLNCSEILQPGLVVSVGGGGGCRRSFLVGSESGASCTDVAANRGVALEALAAANGHLDCQKPLLPGTALCLEMGRLAPEDPATCTQAQEAGYGDTCHTLEKRLGVSQEDLLRFNPGLSCAKPIENGHSLCTNISSSVAPVRPRKCARWHRVKHGDSCPSLWSAANISASEFQRMNPGQRCFGSYWRVGQLVCLEDSLTEENLGASLVPYTVQENDTLAYIVEIMKDSCGKDASFEAITAINDLMNSSSIYPGQLLHIPCGKKLTRTCGCMPSTPVFGDNGIWYTSECDAKCNFALPYTRYANICKRSCLNRAGLPRATVVGGSQVPPYCSSPCPFPQWLPFPYPLAKPSDKCKTYIKACQIWCSASATTLGGTSNNWQANYAGCLFICRKGKC